MYLDYINVFKIDHTLITIYRYITNINPHPESEGNLYWLSVTILRTIIL